MKRQGVDRRLPDVWSVETGRAPGGDVLRPAAEAGTPRPQLRPGRRPGAHQSSGLAETHCVISRLALVGLAYGVSLGG